VGVGAAGDTSIKELTQDIPVFMLEKLNREKGGKRDNRDKKR